MEKLRRYDHLNLSLLPWQQDVLNNLRLNGGERASGDTGIDSVWWLLDDGRVSRISLPSHCYCLHWMTNPVRLYM